MPVHSEEHFESQLSKFPHVVAIEIKGLHRTKPSVVRNELLFQEGDVLTTVDLLESIQELKNLRIFSYVRPFLELQSGNKVKLIIELQEKWTTIPFFSFSTGGGTEHFYAGIYDINTFGEYIETGVQYDNWNRKHGGIFWFRNPRFLNTHNTIGFEIGATQRPRYLYDRQTNNQAHYVLERKELTLTYKFEIHKFFKAGALLEYFDDNLHSIEIDNLDAITLSKLLDNQQSKILLNTLTLELGKLNYDIDIVKGQKTELLLSYSNDNLISDHTFRKFKWINQAYFQLPWHSYIATNFTLAATDAQLIQQYYYVGGFSHIRGYLDGQFRDRSYWQLNTEYRIPSYRSSWIILQHIFFADIANAANHISKLGNFNKNIYSFGAGIRIISPRVYRFNGRLDFAFFTSENSKTSISMGTQHFF